MICLMQLKIKREIKNKGKTFFKKTYKQRVSWFKRKRNTANIKGNISVQFLLLMNSRQTGNNSTLGI